MNLYTTYTTAHQGEGAALYTKDKYPKYYQQKENGFINKMTAMTQQAQDNSGIEQAEDKEKYEIRLYRNHTVVQVKFMVNEYRAVALNQSLDPIESTSASYPKSGTKVSRLYSLSGDQDNNDFNKLNNVLMIVEQFFKQNRVKNMFIRQALV